MATQRQIEANRRNAKKSTGPRSAEGKARSSRNSFRHGLSIPSGHIEAFARDVIELVTIIGSPEDDSSATYAVAEGQIDLLRVQRSRASMMNAVSGRDMSQLAKELTKLDRYERKAFLKRNTGLRELESARKL
jgi:hypothetical protein